MSIVSFAKLKIWEVNCQLHQRLGIKWKQTWDVHILSIAHGSYVVIWFKHCNRVEIRKKNMKVLWTTA
jgi:hypothetical protein